jgi:hypothetical protein
MKNWYVWALLLLLFSCGLSKENGKTTKNKQEWLISADTLRASNIAIEYIYPTKLQKDFIQNGLCFGNTNDLDEEFPNDMILCIWFNDEALENVEEIIASEGKSIPNSKTEKTRINVDGKSGLKVDYFSSKGKVIKQIVFLKHKGIIFQIIGNRFPEIDFEYFLKNLKIKNIS